MNCIGVTWSFEEEGNTAFVQVNTIDIILKMKFSFTAMTTPTQHEKQLNRATSHNDTRTLETINTPFPRFKNPHFRNEAKYKTFLVIKSFLGMKIKNHCISVVWYRGLEQLRKGLL